MAAKKAAKKPASKKAAKPAVKAAGKKAAPAPKKAAPKKRVKVLKASAEIVAAAERSAKRAAKGAPIKKKTSGVAAVAKKPAPRKSTAAYTLYGVHLSLPSSKVGLMLSLCGVAFDFRSVDMRAGAHKTPEFLGKNRFGQVPVLEHAGHAIAQSNVILEYLSRVTGRFAGHNDLERLRVAEWLMWEQDRLANGVGLTRGLVRFGQPHHEVVAFLRQRGERALETLDRHLGTAKYLAGAAPTIADIAVFPWIATAEEGGFDIARWPNVQAWAQRVLALPGAAHPYAIMPKEDRDAA
jgi:glutathione S-transferase